MYMHVWRWAVSARVSPVWVGVCVGECVRCQVGGQPGGPQPADEDGWMNVNISFTLLSQRLGWFICLRRRCHFTCLMCGPTTPTDGSFRAPLLSITTCLCVCAYVCVCGWVGLSPGPLRNVPLAVCTSAWEPPPWENCAFVNASGHPASSAIVFFIETSGVFQKQVLKNKCRNVVSCCSCPLQMVSLGRRVPSSPCHLLFSPTNHLLSSFYLSPSFRRALTLTHLPSHFVLLCFSPVPVKDKNCCGRGTKNTNMVLFDRSVLKSTTLFTYNLSCFVFVLLHLYRRQQLLG